VNNVMPTYQHRQATLAATWVTILGHTVTAFNKATQANSAWSWSSLSG